MAEIAGLKLIVPTSVAGSGVSVSASGKVTFTASTSISVNGCFSASYDNYLIVFRQKNSVSTTSTYGRLRSSGTDASGSNYTQQQLYAGGSTVGAFRSTSQTEFRIGDTTTGGSADQIYFYGPYLAQPTGTRNVSVDSANTVSLDDIACTHSLSTSYDGVTIFCSNALTGALCVYGLSQ